MTRIARWLSAGGLGLVLALLCGPAGGAETSAAWPTYRHDASRSGIASEALAPPLAPAWTFVPPLPPEHAWGDPQPKPIEHNLELPRLRFDDAYHVAAGQGLVTFGSSADGQVYALDAATGEVRWRFATEGPVRCAPTLAGGRLYVGSDDGRVYCLNAADGALVWTFRAAPTPERLLGNGRMISAWPVRTGVLVAGGTAYFAAGVFPAEGLFLCAVDAATGRLRWTNDTYAQGGRSGISPQGYLLASADRLFVPSGRAMPAAFERDSGRFLFQRNFSWRAVGLFGGTYTLLAGDLLFNGTEQIAAVSTKDGKLVLNEGRPSYEPAAGSRRLIVADDSIYMLTGKEAAAFARKDWIDVQKRLTTFKPRMIDLTRRLGDVRRRLRDRDSDGLRKEEKRLAQAIENLQPEKKRLAAQLADCTHWRVPCDASDALILAGGTLYAGGEDKVLALETGSGKTTWSAEVEGRARGLAVAEGRLLASTHTGRIYAFAAGEAGAAGARTVTVKATNDPFPEDEAAGRREAAEDIVKAFGLARGYGLVLGGDGPLALELARRTDLRLHLPVSDASTAARLRRALVEAGVHGSGVTVTRAPPGPLPYSDYFARVVVCTADFFADKSVVPAEEVARMLKPCGGIVLMERPAGAEEPPPAAMQTWMDALREDLARSGEVAPQAAAGRWLAFRRGALDDVGAWTHEYGDAGNTGSSDDGRVRGPLGILWYGRPGPAEMPNRHASAASPLAVGGRLFVQGENVLMAYDAYDGVRLWRREVPGAMRLGLKTRTSNLAARPDSVFVAVEDRCLRLDAATGETVRTYKCPKGDGSQAWRYIAVDGDRLFGCTQGGLLFAFDVDSGDVRWTRQGKEVMETTVCLDGGRLFYVGRHVTDDERKKGLAGIDPKKRVDRRGRPVPPDVRRVVALDAATGKPVWQRPQYVGDCVSISSGGGDLSVMTAGGVVLLCGQPWNGHFWEEFFAGAFSRRSLIALSADDGRELWSGRKGYRSRPLIVGDTIYAEPWAYDLRTGEPKTRRHPVTGAYGRWQMARPGHHCGNIVGAPHALFFRSGSTAYYDLAADEGTAHFGSQRPGCWINCIPACGLVLMPEASSGCVCPFSLHCTIAFHHRKRNRVWGMASADGPATPVRHLAVNFGAPGDRRGPDGRLWLAYPRPYQGRLVLDLDLGVDWKTAWGHRMAHPDFVEVAGTDTPWLYAGALASREAYRFTVPLTKEDGKEAAYTVRLHFCAPEGEAPGRRRMDVTLAGKTVLEGLDVAKEAGGTNRAVVKTFEGVRAGTSLTVALSRTAGEGLGPLLAAIEVRRE
ncbi:MAG: PQQ-binding-like beta-propeller repeat protein [Phycisphaerae bacterium]